MCSERDSPLKRLYRRTHPIYSPGRLRVACLSHWLRALASSRSCSAACVTRRDIRDNTLGGPAAQNAAARSHTSELTRGRFCFRVSTGGLRWAPQMSRASSGWPGAGKRKGSRGLSLSLHISGPVKAQKFPRCLRFLFLWDAAEIHVSLSGPGPRLNIKTIFPRYEDSHFKDKTVVRPYYF